MRSSSPRPRSGLSFRRTAAAALLAIVGIALATSLKPREFARRADLLVRALRGETIPSGQGTRYWFDPAYAEFLEEVRRRTPEDARVVILAPRVPDTYAYLAVYVLAPRRVLTDPGSGEPGFVASYRSAPGARGEPITQGTLERR